VHPNTRACVAFVAARLISGLGSSSVYDYSQSRHISIDGSVDQNQVSVYDYDRRCHFGGSPSSLYDYGRRAHVSLDISGRSFSGYDHGDRHHFSGTVTGNSISFYDFGEARYFNYSV
jgi:hypothetical protein